MIESPSIQRAAARRSGLPPLVRWLAPPAGPRWWRLARWPIALLFVLFGLGTIGAAIGLHLEGVATESWPTTTGQVLDTSIDEGRATAPRSTGRGGRFRPVYTPRVRFIYTVAGRTYQGERLALDLATYRVYDEAVAVTVRYPVGAPVVVAYDPAQPERAVLEPGREGSDTVWGLLVGVGALGGGLLLLRFGHLRPLRRRRT